MGVCIWGQAQARGSFRTNSTSLHARRRSSTQAAMADNIYSKGTRVWFTDKDQGWISAEVVQVSKGDNDSIKLVFVDERGKVLSRRFSSCCALADALYPQEITIETTGKDIKDGKGDLPPLRNPPLLETADDLATLSHLNEPSGELHDFETYSLWDVSVSHGGRIPTTNSRTAGVARALVYALPTYDSSATRR